MKFLPLVLKNLFRRKIRTTLTILSVVVALFLFGLLAIIDLSFGGATVVAGADRLIVTSRTSIIVPLQLSQKAQMEQIPGVSLVTYASWFGGVYQEEKNFFPQFAIEGKEYFEMYPEFLVPEDQMRAFDEDGEGCIVGRNTAKRFGFQLGDRIPLKATIFQDGRPWEFNVRGIYDGSRPEDDTTQFVFHHKRIEERIGFWDGLAGWYMVRVDDPAQAEAISRAIDERFANSRNETKAQPEEVWLAGWIQQIGNVRLIIISIGVVVLFTLLLVTGNTMAIAVRERTGELAVLKTIGFPDRLVLVLVLAESVTMAVAGGTLGLFLARGIPNPAPAFLPLFHLSDARLLQGLGLSVLVGLAAGIIPAVSAMRLRIVDALRRV